jgi:hypothetical protein
MLTHNHPVNEIEGDEPAATEDETRAALLDRSKRDFAPVRKLFVQTAPGSASRPGPLAEFVHNRDLRGLRAYLLLLGIISSGDSEDGWSTTLPIGVWARAFGTTARGTTTASATSAVSKILTRLEKRDLITRQRHGSERKIRITLLREDGSGQPYTRPGKDNSERFLRLPHAFWREGWHERLDLPATAMLLVALHEKNNFALPTERVPEWYGWSADTAERGLATLEQAGALTHIIRLKKAPLSPTGHVRVNKYLLHPPFVRLTNDEIDEDMIEAVLDPAPRKRIPGKAAVGATGEKASS